MSLKTKKHKLLKLLTREELESATVRSLCIADLMRVLKCSYSGHNSNRLKEMIIEHRLDISHFLSPVELHRRSGLRLAELYGIPNNKVFCKGSKVCQNTLVKKFKALACVDHKCACCGQLSEWNGKPLTLQLDHINGICNDNRVENLRWVCPNCHAQTPTFARGNNGNVPRHISKRRQRNIDLRLAKLYRSSS